LANDLQNTASVFQKYKILKYLFKRKFHSM